MKVTVQLITYNAEKYLPFLFDSLRNQTFTDWQLLILDNNSTDRTVEILQHEIKTIVQSVELLLSKENLGFVGGHNTLFNKSRSEYVLLLNPDMYLEEDCIEKLVHALDELSDAGAVTARLMKWDFGVLQNPPLRGAEGGVHVLRTKVEHPPPPPQGGIGGFTDIVDSLGLKVLRSRRVVELYAGKKWNGLLNNQLFNQSTNQPLEVFGVSGALPLYRRSALETVADKNGAIFDPLFFLYKEDVDLAFRLREAGYTAYTILNAVAYHDRSAAMPETEGDRGIAANKRTQSEVVKYHSYKNHLMTLYKNEYWQNVLLDLPWIVWYEMKKLLWFLVFDRKILKGLEELRRNRALLSSERRYITEKIKKVSWHEMRTWFR